MNLGVMKAALLMGMAGLCLGFAVPMRAEEATAALSGTIRSATGAAVAKAKVSVKNVATGASKETETDSAGHYNFSHSCKGRAAGSSR